MNPQCHAKKSINECTSDVQMRLRGRTAADQIALQPNTVTWTTESGMGGDNILTNTAASAAGGMATQKKPVLIFIEFTDESPKQA